MWGDARFAENLILTASGIWLTVWVLIEARRAWRARPPVTWDPYELRWRARRGTHRQPPRGGRP